MAGKKTAFNLKWLDDNSWSTSLEKSGKSRGFLSAWKVATLSEYRIWYKA